MRGAMRVATRASAPSLGRRCATVSPLGLRRPTVAVVSPSDNPALRHTPHEYADFLVADSMTGMLAHGEKLTRAEALLWIPPGPPALLSELLHAGHLPSLRWAHGFYAGVDGMGGFVQDLSATSVELSNGRGAFSTSLAEYAMAAALHFNKQVPRCMENRRERVWDKFVMSELRGKTMGLLGWGHIAQTTAVLARAFGMRVHALRRNANKPESSGLVDLVMVASPSTERARFLQQLSPTAPREAHWLAASCASCRGRTTGRSCLRTSRRSSRTATWWCARFRARRRRPTS